MPEYLLGVKLPKTKKNKLLEDIQNLAPKANKSLYFLYSEYFLRANRNPFYKEVLNKADFLATDGKGALWSQWKIQTPQKLPLFYSKFFLNWSFFFRIPIFLFLFTLELIINIPSGFLALFRKTNWLLKTGNELILGRDFVYNLLEIANKKSWRVAVIGGDMENKISLKLKQKYPKATFIQWSRPFDSSLMTDNFSKPTLTNLYTDIPTSKNILEVFPDLKDAQNFLKNNPCDLVFVCLGGKSGKQEFFIDNCLTNTKINCRLITGIGAALDHLGAGRSQKVAPKWMISLGLEWVHRFLTQPYRRLRILDSIFSLWWWTTLQEFTQLTKDRLTTVNIVSNSKNQILLAKRYSQLVTGDVGWAWFQGGVERDVENLKEASPEFLSLIAETGLRELTEETNLKTAELSISHPPIFSDFETTSISLRRFLVLGANYKGQKKYLNFIKTESEKELKTNWENKASLWFEKDSVANFLVPEKLTDWQKALEVLGK